MNDRTRQRLLNAALVTAVITVIVGNAWDIFWGDTPLWLPVLMCTISIPLAVIGYRRKRRNERRESGLCGCCAYNLTGNVSGVCPECGTAVPQQQSRQVR